MKINYVSSASFGKKAYTKNGNEYEKTNKGKIIGSSLGAVGAVATLSVPKILSHMFKYPMGHVFPKKSLIFSALSSIALGFSVGAVLDAAKNKSKAHKVDEKVNG